jgi:hypothetical protein
MPDGCGTLRTIHTARHNVRRQAMKTAASIFLVLICCSISSSVAAQDPQDLKAELPRDIRIMLLGVPSIEGSVAALDNLRNAVQEYEDDLGREGIAASKLDQDKARVYFRLGQLDQNLSALVKAMRDQERIKGLEEYRDLARELELRSESLASLSGTSSSPTISEDGDAPPAASTPNSPAEFAKQVKAELAKIHDVLRKIDQKAKPDEERKAQLEKDVGALGQFVFKMKNLADGIRAAESGQGEVTVDTNEIVRGVQGLVESIRRLKQEREQRNATEPKDRTDPKRTQQPRVRINL